MVVSDAHVFPGFLIPGLTQLSFSKPPTTFLTCFCRGERWKYAGKKVHLYWESNLQPPGHESDTITTKPPWHDARVMEFNAVSYRKKESSGLSSFSTFSALIKYGNYCEDDHLSLYGWSIQLFYHHTRECPATFGFSVFVPRLKQLQLS